MRTRPEEARNQSATRLLAQLLLACCLALLPAADAVAQGSKSNAAYQWPAEIAAERERLFAALKAAGSQAEARAIEARIWRLWLSPADPEVSAKMREVMLLRQRQDYRAALAVIDEIIAIEPGYPESWNQRATILFLLNDFEASLEAVEETLKREPKHFGALAGQMLIFLRLNRPALAKSALLRALTVNPWLRERALLDRLPGGGGIEL